MNIRTRLIDLAGQENCDGEPYDTMMLAADEIERLSKIEARMKGLRELCGYVHDGSETAVNISQDDATRSFILRCGKREYYADSFDNVVDAAIGSC